MQSLERLPEFNRVVFGDLHLELLPSVVQIFQLELAWIETQVLDSYELKERTAFFQSVNEIPTKHYLLFEKEKISTGYAVHDLYPTRARFHPQIVKGILNAIHINRGEVVLDPMCGSGTTNLEAIFLGANSIAVDLNPISRLMTRVKYEVLKLPIEQVQSLKERARELYDFFRNPENLATIQQIENEQERTIFYLGLLAFLHAMGRSDADRRQRRGQERQYPSFKTYQKILSWYQRVISVFIGNEEFNAYEFGELQVLSNTDARVLEEISDESIDAVVTSPPYSLVTDYLRDDRRQLEYLGVDIAALREKMIGLSPARYEDRVEQYLQDMEQVIAAIARVLKPQKWFVLVIGRPSLRSIEIDLVGKIKEMADGQGFHLYRDIQKPIKGIHDEFHDEHILFFKKELSSS